MHDILVEGYRGDVLENIHVGNIAIVDDAGKVVYGAGDVNFMNCYRSCSKPLQALPILLHGLDEKYQLTTREMAILCASHLAEPIHVETIEGILKKGGFTEDDFIMNPTYPSMKSLADEYLAKGMPKRKIYHNCTGKHSGLLLLAKEVDEDYHDYWKVDSNAQKEIIEVIAKVCEYPKEDIKIGIDGCGVPVYSVPLYKAAYSYNKLANPDIEKDPEISKGLAKFGAAMNAEPLMIRGSNSLCLAINSDPNLVGKLGAFGVYTIGMRNERLGIAIKMLDGDTNQLPMVVKSIFEQIGYKNDELFAKLDAQPGWNMLNDNGTLVGTRKAAFELKKY